VGTGRYRPGRSGTPADRVQAAPRILTRSVLTRV
jgi:hypothetical protein